MSETWRAIPPKRSQRPPIPAIDITGEYGGCVISGPLDGAPASADAKWSVYVMNQDTVTSLNLTGAQLADIWAFVRRGWDASHG